MKHCKSIYLLKVFVFSVLLIGVALYAQAQTFFVSPNGDDRRSGRSWQEAKQTIQATINAAPSGSTIFIQEGRYRFQNIVIPSETNFQIFGGCLGFEKDPSERPELPEVEYRDEFPHQTIIDGLTDLGERTERFGVYVRNPGDITLDRLWIRGWKNPNNGKGEYGAGIVAYAPGGRASNFIVRDCVITDNDARFRDGSSGGDGGGVFVQGRTIELGIHTNLFLRNYSRSCGAGICSFYAPGVISGNYLKDNADEEFGGGVYLLECNRMDFINNVALGNNVWFPAEGGEPSGPGGALMGINSNVRILNNVIIGNSAKEGGAFYFTGGNVIIEWNVISFNEARNSFETGGLGGAIVARPTGADSLRLTVSHNVITDNIADTAGGAFLLDSSESGTVEASLINNLITNNSTTRGGGACYVNQVNQLRLTNNTLYGNQSDFGAGLCLVRPGANSFEIYNNIISFNQGSGLFAPYDFMAQILFFNNNVYGNLQNYEGLSDRTGVNGNLSLDPLYIDPFAQNFRLGAGSPCINAGTAQAPGLPAVDLDGLLRIVGASPDMGAYEWAD